MNKKQIMILLLVVAVLMIGAGMVLGTPRKAKPKETKDFTEVMEQMKSLTSFYGDTKVVNIQNQSPSIIQTYRINQETKLQEIWNDDIVLLIRDYQNKVEYSNQQGYGYLKIESKTDPNILFLYPLLSRPMVHQETNKYTCTVSKEEYERLLKQSQTFYNGFSDEKDPIEGEIELTITLDKNYLKEVKVSFLTASQRRVEIIESFSKYNETVDIQIPEAS